MVSRELPPHGGGIGSYTEKTARALAVRGHEVHVISETWEGAPSVETVEGVTVHRLARPRLRPSVIGRAFVVARALRGLGRLDVVQACEWGGEASLFAIRPTAPLVTRLATPHYVVEAVNGLSRRQRLHTVASRALERVQARRSAGLVSPSAALAREVSRAWRIPSERIAVVPTGIIPPNVDNPIPPALDAALRAGSTASALPEYVLYFGRLETRKGVDVWIDALPQVLSAHPDVHAVFVGEDMGFDGRPFGERARERAGGDAGRVHVLPRLPHRELFPVVAGAALVVMPSRWENLANACLEAMSLGRPVLACSGSGFDEVITHGVDGFLVSPGAIRPLAEAASDALADRRRLAAVGEAARRRAADFDLDAMAGRLLDTYDVLVGVHPAAAAGLAAGGETKRCA